MDERLNSMEGCRRILNGLFEMSPEEIGKIDIAVLNLLCAQALPGNENLDVSGCLACLDHLTNYIKGSIERTLNAYGPSPDYSNCTHQTKMAILVTRMKQEFGASYSPQAKADLEAGINAPFTDASEVFINGLLNNDRFRRWGTCSSLPVLVTAIARRLRYPVRLACARQHLYCRWEGEGTAFNIEASNAMGMAVLPDEHYRQLRGGVASDFAKDGYYFRSLTPAEEFACFMKDRVAVLHDATRYDEALFWSARALQFAPDDCVFATDAYKACDRILGDRLRLKYPDQKFQEWSNFSGPIEHVVRSHEWPLLHTINAHYREFLGDMNAARDAYEQACRFNFQGRNEQRDIQRFLQKHRTPPRSQQSIPRDVKMLQRCRLSCEDDRKAGVLQSLSDKYLTGGELLKARDALHDLYLINPSNAEVFERARTIENHPRFCEQLKEARQRGYLQNQASVLNVPAV